MDQAPSATPADPKTLNHPIRPGYLNAGTAFQLLTNAFPIRTKSGVKLHRYDIVRVRGVRWQKRDEQSDISRKPPDTPKDPTGRRRKQVISLFLTEGVSAEYRNQMASDFSTFIISAKEITKNGVQVLEPTREVGCKGDFETTFAPWYAVYNVELKKTTEWDLDVLINYLVTANSRDGSVSYEGFRQVLNVILGTWAKLQPDQMIMSLGQQHYRQHDTQGNFNGILLDGIIAASRGYVSSARYSGGTLLAQVQIKHAPIYHQINMLEVINDMSQRARRPWAQISTAIKGIVVKLLHLPPIDTTRGFSVYPTRTVIGLAMMDDTKKATKQKANPPKVNQDFGSADHVRFFNSASKKYETVREYFKKQHKKDLGPGNEAIVLKLGSEESPVYVPAKFCEIREGQPYRTTLSGFQTQRMLRTAARRPNENAASIQGDSHNALNLGGPIVVSHRSRY